MVDARVQTYVAELDLPTCFYAQMNHSHPIPEPGWFDIISGYYRLRTPRNQSDSINYPTISLVIKFLSSNLRDAENHAFRVARLFGSLMSAYGGYPLEGPLLRRIANIGSNAQMKSQHNYLYGARPYMLLNYDQMVDYQYLHYLKSVSSIDVNDKSQIQSAIHWYGRAISEDEPTVSYVAAWTGLECIGPLIDRIAHPNGSKVQCATCCNKAGIKRRRFKAGITHMFNRIAGGPFSSSLSAETLALVQSELINGFSSEDAQKLRDAIVHGLGNIESLTQKCSEVRRHLMHVLNASIQVALGPSVKTWATGDFEFHPIERASIKCIENVTKSPYHGEWFEGLDFEVQPMVPEAERMFTATFKMEWQLDGRLIDMLSTEGFKRDTDIFGPDGSEILDFPKWAERPLEPPWQTVAEFLEQEGN